MKKAGAALALLALALPGAHPFAMPAGTVAAGATGSPPRALCFRFRALGLG